MYIWSDAFKFIFILVFLIVIIGFIVTASNGIKSYNKNNNSLRLTVEANVVAKKEGITYNQDSKIKDITGASYSATTLTTYYVTFQVESGDKIEFSVSGDEYAKLKEGDYGRLTFQGRRYLGFERQ